MSRQGSTLTISDLAATIIEPYVPLRDACFARRVDFRAALDEVCRRSEVEQAGALTIVETLRAEIVAGQWP
jgi:hypothetical protein